MLKKAFWKRYLTDWSNIVYKLVALSILIPLIHLFGGSPIAFLCGYVIFDPILYYKLLYSAAK